MSRRRPSERGPAVTAGGGSSTVGAGLHHLLTAIPTVVLWALVALWTLPTVGMLVSSFRPEVVVRSSGWWTDLPDPAPDRFGRSVLVGLLLVTVAALLAHAASPQVRPRRRATAVAAALAAVALVGVLYPGAYAATPAALALLAAVAGVLALGWLLGRGMARLSRSLRALVGAAVVLAVVGTVVVSATELTLDNYRDVFSSGGSDAPNMWQHFLNSVAISLPATVIPIAFSAFAAYAFAWIDFRGRHWLFVGVVALLAVPFQMSLVPLVQLYNDGAHLTVYGETFTVFPHLDLADSTTAVWLTHIGFGLPLAIFLLHNYIASLPRDIFEAARIDGADHPTIFWRLVLPLSVPALAAFAIFQFLWVWNDFLVARTFLGSGGAGFDNAPMTIRLATLSGSRGEDWHLLTSAAFVSIAVPVLIFFVLQRYFVRGLLAGSVKG